MEGVFAICLAELFANGTINKSNVNRWRRQIDPGIFKNGRSEIVVREFKDGRPQDQIKVTLIIRLKYESTNMAFGPNYAPLYEKSSDVGNIDRKIEEFIDGDFEIKMTSDYGPSEVNAGVMLLKNSDWVKDYLNKWWDICEEFPQYKTGLWHDQTCIGLLNERIDKTKFSMSK